MMEQPTVNPQDVLNKVIDGGFYNPHIPSEETRRGDPVSPFMCFSIERACVARVITCAESRVLRKEIGQYLEYLLSPNYHYCPHASSLIRALELIGHNHSPDDQLAIYRDWNNRPRILQE